MSKSNNFQKAFTLLELLLVITSIGVLAALLLPALAKAKDKARSTQCLGNLRQLTLCSHLYAGDNDDLLPPNDSVVTPDGTPNGQTIAEGVSWCPDHPQTDINTVNIERGVLFGYNRSVAIYHCPADTATLQTTNGQPLPQLRQRSYNMSQSVNGFPDYDEVLAANIPSFPKFTAIRDPAASKLIVFLEVHEDEILDTLFGIPTQIEESWYRQYWFDVPANRHDQGENLSFADGHVEHWRWKTPKAITVPRGTMQPVTPEEMDDYLRLQSGFRQTFN